MNNPKLTWIALAVVLAGALGFFLARRGERDRLSIRTYSVPASRAEEIKNVLNRMFSSDKNDGGAQVFGNGTLVVKGSEGYQTGIAQLVSEVSEKRPNLHTIHFDYWMVRGEPAAQGNAEALGPLTPVLDSVNKAEGPHKFVLLEHIAYNSLDRREVAMQSSWAEVKTVTKEVDAGIELMTEINAHDLGALKINTQVKPGELVLLGQNITQPHARELAVGKGSSFDEAHPKEIYHIIRAEVAQ